MVRKKSEIDFSTSNLIAENKVAADTTLVETELSNHPVGMDVVQIEIISHSERNVETTMDEIESEKIVVGNDEVNGYKKNVAKEEGKGEDHASEEEEGANENEENGADEDGNRDELAAEEDDSDVGDDYDDDYVDDYEDDDDDVDIDEDNDDVDFDEDDDLMEEDGDIEHKESDVYEDEDNKESTMEGECEKEENEEKGGVSVVPKVKTLGKKNGRKEGVKRDLGKVTSKSEDKSERDEEKDPMVEEDEQNAKEKTEEKGEGSAQKKVKKLRKRNRRKVTRGRSEKLSSKQEDKLESSHRKKTSKKVESMGMIFMCNSKTKKDCFQYKVLGLPASKRDIVGKIYKGMRLFLYDVDLKLMYGIYKAVGSGGYNVEPKAFKSQFPSQVRFTVLEDCIPLAEEKFKNVIKENYFTKTKFDCQLKSEQVKKLCKVFVAASKGPRSKRLDRGLKEKIRASRKQDRPGARSVYEERRSALDEKHQYLDYPHIHQRDLIAYPPATAPSYAYDRIMEIDSYRRNALVDHHDSYRLPLLESRDAYRREPYVQPLLESRDAYRREPLIEYHDVYRLDPLLNNRDSYRRDVAVEHRDRRPVKLELRHRNEIAGHDPYILYRERQSYHDAVYSEHLSSERDRYHAGGVRPDYQSREAPLPEYRSTRAPYRY